MNRLLTLCLLSLLVSSTYANDSYRCKKHNALSVDSYYWVELERDSNDQLKFVYGTGIKTQMMEIYFDSPVEEVSSGHFSHHENDYQLEAKVENSQLSFVITAGKKSVKEGHFLCE